jgi:GT2 family glycosyltransferase
MSGNIIDVAVVTVTYNSSRVIEGFLASLDAGMDGLSWTLVVADNDSRDGTVGVVEQWAAARPAADCTIVQTGYNAGYAAGINAALAKAPPHRAALILNPDLRLGPGCARRMAQVAADEPDAGIVVPRMFDESGAAARSLRREPTVLRAAGEALLGERAGRFPRFGEVMFDQAAYTARTRADWATGAAMYISHACLAGCGPWDESFLLYSEETEFSLRARDRGFATVLAPDAAVVHLGGESSVSPRLWTLLMVNRLRLFRRRRGLAAAAAYWGALMLREVPRAAAGQRRSRRAVAALLAPSLLRDPRVILHGRNDAGHA